MRIKWIVVIAFIVIGNLLINLVEVPVNWALPITIVCNALIFGMVFFWKEKEKK